MFASWIWAMPGGPTGNRGPLPQGLKIFLIIGGLVLGGALVALVVWGAMTGPRSRRKVARVLATGIRARARVVLIRELPNVRGLYELTLEVATTPAFVAKSMATIPLELLPAMQVGSELNVRCDSQYRSNVVIEAPGVEAHLFG